MYKLFVVAAALVASSTAQSLPDTADSQPAQPLTGGQCDYAGFYNCQMQQQQGMPEAAQGCIQIEGGGPNCVRQTTDCDQQCVTGYAYQKVNSDDASCICSKRDAACYVGADQSACGEPFDDGSDGQGSEGTVWQA